MDMAIARLQPQRRICTVEVSTTRSTGSPHNAFRSAFGAQKRGGAIKRSAVPEDAPLDEWQRGAVERFMPLALSLGRSFWVRVGRHELGDWTGVACVGLVEGVRHFDWRRRIPFAAYVRWWVMKYLQMYQQRGVNVITLPFREKEHRHETVGLVNGLEESVGSRDQARGAHQLPLDWKQAPTDSSASGILAACDTDMERDVLWLSAVHAMPDDEVARFLRRERGRRLERDEVKAVRRATIARLRGTVRALV